MKTSHYYIQGKPGDWRIYHVKGGLVESLKNRGQALTIMQGLENRANGKQGGPRVRYSFRKVYAYLRAMGWRIELHTPPHVYWFHQGSGKRVKENRQLSAKQFLLSCYRNVPGGDKETLQGYWTWHHAGATISQHGNQDRNP